MVRYNIQYQTLGKHKEIVPLKHIEDYTLWKHVAPKSYTDKQNPCVFKGDVLRWTR